MSDIEEEKILKSNNIQLCIDDKIKIIEQMKFSVCKIHKENSNGTGFFCKIPISEPENEYINVLITNNHILNEKDLHTNNNEEKNVVFSLNDDKIPQKLIIKNRIKYTNKDLDITFIEIKRSDSFYKIIKFLEIEDMLNKDNDIINKVYSNKPVYILHYPEGGKKIYSSYGKIKAIEKFKIKHECSSNSGSSGSPILLLEEKTVIGVHYGANKRFDNNEGTLLKYAIDNFYIRYKPHLEKKISKYKINYNTIEKESNDNSNNNENYQDFPKKENNYRKIDINRNKNKNLYLETDVNEGNRNYLKNLNIGMEKENQNNKKQNISNKNNLNYYPNNATPRNTNRKILEPFYNDNKINNTLNNENNNLYKGMNKQLRINNNIDMNNNLRTNNNMNMNYNISMNNNLRTNNNINMNYNINMNNNLRMNNNMNRKKNIQQNIVGYNDSNIYNNIKKSYENNQYKIKENHYPRPYLKSTRNEEEEDLYSENRKIPNKFFSKFNI